MFIPRDNYNVCNCVVDFKTNSNPTPYDTL